MWRAWAGPSHTFASAESVYFRRKHHTQPSSVLEGDVPARPRDPRVYPVVVVRTSDIRPPCEFEERHSEDGLQFVVVWRLLELGLLDLLQQVQQHLLELRREVLAKRMFLCDFLQVDARSHWNQIHHTPFLLPHRLCIQIAVNDPFVVPWQAAPQHKSHRVHHGLHVVPPALFNPLVRSHGSVTARPDERKAFGFGDMILAVDSVLACEPHVDQMQLLPLSF
mmetsp:Transcript_23678/g.48331  ORF Transcript_23678/g.48331 Transcript_23678/m.48331 type:complete len:222 (-) Transcript_23678:994-1659(-)